MLVDGDVDSVIVVNSKVGTINTCRYFLCIYTESIYRLPIEAR